MLWQVVPVALVTSLLTTLLTTLATLYLSERKLKRDYRLEFNAEHVARSLLRDERWKLRRFETIRRHFGGFEDSELRRVLIRAGALRFESPSGDELWGLLELNGDRLERATADESG